MRFKTILVFSTVAMLFTACSNTPGCAQPDGTGECQQRTQKDKNYDDSDLKTAAFPYKPIIGTRNNDAKTVVDQGVVLKVYIATYKDSHHDLVASHDKYVWAKKPQFIVGLEQPEVRKRTGMMTSAGKVPFVFGAGEIDASSITDNSKIRDYVKAVDSSEIKATQALSNINTADEKFDKTIKNYINK